ncbi:MAG: hypothetical protein NVS3B7_08690 [Candidatus Elarobacter sp.]
MTILVPRGAEAAAVRAAHTGAHVVVVPAGAAAAGALPDALDEPVVVLGLCGALRDRSVGDVVVYRCVAGGSRVVVLDAELARDVAGGIASARLVNACSTGHVVTTARERRELAAAYDAEVVDMEGSALAAALDARRLRFAMVRVVSDDASRDLPAIEGALAADGSLRIGRLATAFLRRPRAAVHFVRGVRTALRGLTATARAVVDDRRRSAAATKPASQKV